MYLHKDSIYTNPYKYAYICDVPIEYARIVQKRQNNIAKIIYNARKCPKCGSHSLCFEGGSYEEGYDDYIYCENDECEADYEVSEIKNGQYLSGWLDFDVVWYGLINVDDEKKKEYRLMMCGSDNINEWHKFAWDHIRG